MGFSALIPKRLSAEGCCIVGSKINTRIKAYLADNTPLPPEIVAEFSATWRATHQIGLLSCYNATQEETASACVESLVAFRSHLSSFIGLLVHSSIEPLPAGIIARANAARYLLDMIFLAPFESLKQRPAEQWPFLEKLATFLSSPEATERLVVLRLKEEAAHIANWIERYGKRLGHIKLTQTEIATIEDLADAWHEAFGEFLAKLFSLPGDAPATTSLRDYLLAPYSERAELERAWSAYAGF